MDQNAGYAVDDVKWSIYAERTLFDSFGAVLQFAEDHKRLIRTDVGGELTDYGYTELPGDRHWWRKFFYMF